jgi:hypothetical protein
MNTMKLIRLISCGALVLAVGIVGAVASAGPGSTSVKIRAAEFDPERVCDAKPAWVKLIGLFFAPPGQVDRFAYGFRMHKLCSTPTNAAAFGLISGVEGEFLNTPGALGFDYKDVNGGFTAHCGAGAPRFQASMTDGFHFFGGCANGTSAPSPRGTGWTQVRFDPQSSSQAFPPVAPFATIISLQLVFDEGPDGDPSGLGSPEIVLDNIVVNGRMVVKP